MTKFFLFIIFISNDECIIIDINSQIKEIVSKDIICPECKENVLIDINSFHINFHDCTNNLNINNMSLNEY